MEQGHVNDPHWRGDASCEGRTTRAFESLTLIKKRKNEQP